MCAAKEHTTGSQQHGNSGK